MLMVDEKISVPGGVSVSLAEGAIKVKGPKGETSVTLSKKVSVKVSGSEIAVSGSKVLVCTTVAHINNALKGVQEGHKKCMKMVFAHFPMKIEVKGSTMTIKNFLGGKRDLHAAIVGPTKVTVKGQDVEIEGPDAYSVGQTAANLRQAARVKGKDERVFQDGIYVVKK
ncbi:MAG: 50S ribosomal protein L6 [Candidatus Micrarchaeota archaeon]|nr:50S ribosomal protein L6 [Candidatus Micrarchaeota archaeon]